MTCAVLEFMAAVGAVGSAATAPSSAPNSPFQAPTPNTDSKAQDQFEALFRDAQHDFDRGDYAGAARKYERALVSRPNSPETLSNLGVTYHMEGSLQSAVSTLRKALSLEPGSLPANLILGID